MLKQCLILSAVLSMLMPTMVSAQTITNGDSLKQRCATFQLTMPTSGLACRGYIGAVADIMADGNTIYDQRACPPPDDKREALVKTVKAWLDRHPESMKQKASAAAVQALAEAYPCAAQ